MLLYDSFHLPYIYNTPSVLWIFKIFYHTFHLFTSYHNYLNKQPLQVAYPHYLQGFFFILLFACFRQISTDSSALRTFPFYVPAAYPRNYAFYWLCTDFDCSKTATFQPYPQILFWGKIHFAF